MFKCECGKEFEKLNSFNAHKSSCRVHFKFKYGSDIVWNEIKAKRAVNSKKTLQENIVRKRQQDLFIWIEEKHTCKTCGKVMTEKFGSGIFCSRPCANKHKNGGPITTYTCQFCGKKFVKDTSLERHILYCDSNPNRRPKATPHKYKLDKDTDLYRINGQINKGLLVNTIADVESYVKTHTKCEICGKTIEETVKWTGSNRAKRLCIDHDHKSMQFRGVLCQVCNRQLGWFEKNKDAIINYLDKPFPLKNKKNLNN